MRNSQTPPRNEPKPAKTAAPKNSLTPLSDAQTSQNRVKKDETRPCKTHLHTKNQPLGSPCETATHHLDTSPNQPKAPKNSLTPLSDALKKDEPQPCNAAFWCPKERWNWTMSSPTSQNHPSEKVSKKVSHVAFWHPTKRWRKASATARLRPTGSRGTGAEIWQYGSFTLQTDEEGPAQAARRGTERSKARLLWRAPPETTGSADLMASQPTPRPPNVPHWFPLNKAFSNLYSRGGYVGGGRLTSHFTTWSPFRLVLRPGL